MYNDEDISVAKSLGESLALGRNFLDMALELAEQGPDTKVDMEAMLNKALVEFHSVRGEVEQLSDPAKENIRFRTAAQVQGHMRKYDKAAETRPELISLKRDKDSLHNPYPVLVEILQVLGVEREEYHNTIVLGNCSPDEKAMIDSYWKKKLWFERGVLIASGAEDPWQKDRTEEAFDPWKAINDAVTEFKIPEPDVEATVQKLDSDMSTYWGLFSSLYELSKGTSGGRTLLNTVIRNTFLKRMKVDCSVTRVIARNKFEHAEEKKGFYIATNIEGVMYGEDGFGATLMQTLDLKDFDNNALISYVYFLRASKAEDPLDRIDLLERALLFNKEEFLIWDYLAETYAKVGDSSNRVRCEKEAESMNLRLDNPRIKHIF